MRPVESVKTQRNMDIFAGRQKGLSFAELGEAHGISSARARDICQIFEIHGDGPDNLYNVPLAERIRILDAAELLDVSKNELLRSLHRHKFETFSRGWGGWAWMKRKDLKRYLLLKSAQAREGAEMMERIAGELEGQAKDL